MKRKIVVGDRVRVKEDSLYAVASYQAKPLGYRRLIGRVKRIGKGRLFIDFRQYDIPRRPDGVLYGERVRTSALYRRRFNFKGPGYPAEIFERVR